MQIAIQYIAGINEENLPVWKPEKNKKTGRGKDDAELW